MCDQSMSYEPGTWVWSKQAGARKLWWPGKVVSLADTPDYFLDHLENSRRKYIAVIYTPSDKTYEAVYSSKQIALYNCSDKSKHVETGYAWYKQQLLDKTITYRNYRMEHFILDVIKAEECTGGDKEIFNQIEIKLSHQNTDEMLEKSSRTTPKRNTLTELTSGVYYHCRYSQCTQTFLSYDIFKRHLKSHKEEAKDACTFTTEQFSQVLKLNVSTSGKSPTKNNPQWPKKQLSSGSTLDQIKNIEKSFCGCSNKRVSETELKNDKKLFENKDTSNGKVSSSSKNGCLMNFLDGIPTPDFHKRLSFKGLDKATREFTNFDMDAIMPNEDNLEFCTNPNPLENFEPTFFTEVVPDLPKEGFERREIWIPDKTDDKILPDEELLKLPFIQKVQALIASGQGDKVKLTISGAKLIRED